MKIAITAESTIDVQKSLLEKFDIKTVQYSILLGDDLILDEDGVQNKIFSYVDKCKILPKTSAVNTQQFIGFFENLLKTHDAIIHFSLSSQMSSSFSNACLAAKEFKNVHIVDSAVLSSGIALEALLAKKLIEQGKTIKEVLEEIEKNKPNMQVSFILDTLNFIYKGGRCSVVQLLGANLLKIKPEIVVKDGKMGMGRKYRGSLYSVVEKYCDDILLDNPNPDIENVFITHPNPMPEIENMLTEKLKNRGFKNIYNTYANGTISSHCGPNCIGVLFINKSEK